jgi:hypothetical protein
VVFSLLMLVAEDVRAFTGEAPPRDIAGWVRTRPPAEWPESVAMCANHGFGGTWYVALEAGQVTVRAYRHGIEGGSPLPESAYERIGQGERARRSWVSVEDGYLVGFDHGEWGGSTWWFSSGGGSDYRVSESGTGRGNPVALFRVGDEVQQVSGLSHLGARWGSIQHIRRHDGKWRVADTVSLGAAAEVAVQHPSLGIVIVTTDGILSYQEGELATLAKVREGDLYPNSMVVAPDGTMYAGMRYTVARLTQSDRGIEIAWFVPPSCRSLEKRADLPYGIDCTCKP